MLSKRKLLTVILTLTVFGCSSRKDMEKPNLSLERISEIVTKEVALRTAKREELKVEIEKEGDQWEVLLSVNPATPGRFYRVIIDKTGKVLSFEGGE